MLKVVQKKGVEKVSDLTLIKADIAEKAVRQLEELVIELTEDKLGREGAEKLARELVHTSYPHDWPLLPNKLREMRLPVKVGIPPEIYQLMELYPQATQLRPSVEFVPAPYYTPRPQRGPERQQLI